MHDSDAFFLVGTIKTSVFICPTKSVVLWHDPGVYLGVSLSVGLSAKNVNPIQTKLFQVGLSNFVQILLHEDDTYCFSW